METKICSDCGIEKNLDEYRYNRYIRSICKSCFKKENRKRNTKIHKKKQTYKKCGCAICGEQTICCLVLHHAIEGNQHRYTNGKPRQPSNLGLDTYFKEITKCIVVCHNCHAKIHAGLIELTDLDILKIRFLQISHYLKLVDIQ